MKKLIHVFYIWLGGYSICIALLLFYYFKQWSFEDNLRVQLVSATNIFAPYLTTILGFWFSQRRARKKPAKAPESDRHTKSESVNIAAACSLIFNLAMVAILAGVMARKQAQIEDALATMRELAIALAFLVGPAIAYLFRGTLEKPNGG